MNGISSTDSPFSPRREPSSTPPPAPRLKATIGPDDTRSDSPISTLELPASLLESSRINPSPCQTPRLTPSPPPIVPDPLYELEDFPEAAMNRRPTTTYQLNRPSPHNMISYINEPNSPMHL